MALLIVDDEPEIRFMLDKFLQKAGYQDLHFAASGQQALDRLGLGSGQQPDQAGASGWELVLLDVMMPDMDGLEVCRRIKAEEGLQDLPIIMITAVGDSATLEQAFAAGAVDYITKPVRRAELLARAGLTIGLFREREARRARTRELEKALEQLAEANRKLEELATIDELTRIPNRRLLNETLSSQWKRARRNRTRLAVLILDIDHFKEYNDGYGHQQGDEALRLLAGKLNELLLRPGDFAARYGGEEFAAVLPETGLPEAEKVAENLRSGVEALALPHAYSPVSPRVTVSVGAAAVDFGAAANRAERGNQDQDEIARAGISNLLESADRALYEAKRQGRNTVRSQPEE